MRIFRFIFTTLMLLAIQKPLLAEIGIIFNGEKAVTLKRYFHTVLPGQKVVFQLLPENSASLQVKVKEGRISLLSSGKWQYTAPSLSGTDKITVYDSAHNTSMLITIFVMVPRYKMKGEYLNGYRIGTYPSTRYKGRANYDRPEGFIEVTADNKDVFITPHFQLVQFVCKQVSGWPKYALLQPKLLVKLEYIIDGLHKRGIPVKTLFIMSGYRTPYYNKSIKNVKNSRHIYGDASDIFIDEDHNSVMDDLNGDGKSNIRDAAVIYDIVNRIDNNPQTKWLLGGLGTYKKTTAHTWFVHVDTRGYRARW